MKIKVTQLLKVEEHKDIFRLFFYMIGDDYEFTSYLSPPFLIDDYHSVYEEYRQQALDYAATVDK